MEDFTDAGYQAIDPTAFEVVVSSGLALIPDPAVSLMTAGVITPPAAVLIATTVTRDGDRNLQLLLSQGALAALHGALVGWAKRLPVGARDQFDSLSADAEAKFTARANEFLGPAS